MNNRRVATIAVAKRVSEEMNVRLGAEVGYSIRFDDETSDTTRVKFMTDGVLVRECLRDRLLSRYNIIVLDEAHERSISTDLLFGLLKQIVVERPKDFKILVTSATLDFKKFSAFFNNAPVIQVPGRTYPVDIYHAKQLQIMGKSGPLSMYIQSTLETIQQIHDTEPLDGHVLVFLTGREEIESVCQTLEEILDHVRILPLYGALQAHQQARIFEPVAPGIRKIIIATNIAETSLTVDGIRFVVDAGFVKQKVYDPIRSIESLVVVPISKVSAQQRAGRAGRTSSGKCFRLYSKESYENMMEETIPEIQRCNLVNTILYLKVLRIKDVMGFQYLDPPAQDLIRDALVQLYQLGAIDKDGMVTKLGTEMSKFPLEPNLSRVLVESIRLDCSTSVVRIVAMLTVEPVFLSSRERKRKRESKHERFFEKRGDHLTFLRVFEASERHKRDLESWCRDNHLNKRSLRLAESVRLQLSELLPLTSRHDSNDRICQAFCAGYFMKAARKGVSSDSVYRCLSDEFQLVQIHPTSCLTDLASPDYVVYHELVHTSKAFMRQVLSVQRDWIDQYAAAVDKSVDGYQLSGRLRADAAAASVVEQKKTMIQEKKKISKRTKEEMIAAARKRYLLRR